ncbi:hypothetical protein FBQ95_11605 [Chloroflexi bacterium CFX3]|nr:hypothetical protein [Chloroflexi bacterium CFX3]
MFSTAGCVGVWVAVLVGVLVSVAVAVLVGVLVGVAVAVLVGVLVGVAVGATHSTVLVEVAPPMISTRRVSVPTMPVTVSVALPPAGTETVPLWTVAPLPSTMV